MSNGTPLPEAGASATRVALRPAARDEAPWLAQLWANAFPGERTAADRLRELEEGGGRFGGLENCWIGEADGVRVGALRSYRLRMGLWGRDWDVQGLAAVAVATSHRRRGIASALCAEGIRVGRESGAALSALYPFRVDFYSRLGYTLAGELHRYTVLPEAFPSFPESRRIREVPAAGASEWLAPFYEGARLRTQGLIDRNPAMWRQIEGAADLVAVVPGEGEALRGYLVARFRPKENPERSTIEVVEHLSGDYEAHRALLGWLALQRDQWRRVVIDALPGEHMERLLSHPRRTGTRGARSGGLWFHSASLLRGPMLRILDVGAVLGTIGTTGTGENVGLTVHDPVLEENSGHWQIGAGGGAGAAPGDAFGAAGRTAEHGAPPGSPPLGIALVTELFLRGDLPGQRAAMGDWAPLLGILDFRLLDTF